MDRPLRVLVCSGNLGNALPDPASIAAWIPQDGCYSQVVNNPEYPLPSPQERDALLQEIGLPPLKVNSENGNRNNSNRSTKNPEEDDYFDIIVVGMQEATFAVKEQDGQIKKELVPIVTPLLNKAQKEIKKKTKKGFATVTTLTGSTDHTSSTANVLVPEWLKAEDSSLLHQLLQDQCPSYDFAIRFQRGEMRLEVMVRKDLEAKVLSVRAQNTGLVNLAANKGGIVGELLVGGTTRISFCTAHLEAHEGIEKYWHRCQMLTDIFSGTADDSFPSVKYDQTLKSHFCFVLGDLNFRTEIDSSLEKQDHHNQVMALVQQKEWKELNQYDEMFRALKDKAMAVGFVTLPCLFPPTFKVERQDGFVYKEQRRPSYTDRILWKSGDQLDGRVTPMAYEPIEHFTTSDHKPIRGAFEIQLNKRVRLREPRMKRRQSLRALRGMAIMNVRTSRNANAPPARQTLHIFVSNLKCTIYQKRKYSEKDNEPTLSPPKHPSQKLLEISKPDPFMAFLSYPKRLVKEERTTLQRIEGFFRGPADLKTETKDDGTISRTVGGWPRTKKLSSTLEPDWSDEGEIHLKVMSHDKHGVPLNHTGSILYFSAFNAANLDLSLIGTYAMNLSMLCSNAYTAQRSQLNGRASIFLKNQAMSEMTSFEVDQPLLKNGRETGRLHCDVDACWLDDLSSSRDLNTMKIDAKQKRLLRRVKSR